MTNGFIIWGSSNDVNTRRKCQKLDQYLTNILGPELIRVNKYRRAHLRPIVDTDYYKSDKNEENDNSEKDDNIDKDN